MKTMISVRLLTCLLLAGSTISAKAYAQQTPPSSLPLISIDDLTYAGAFRLPADLFGASSLNFSEGPIAYNSSRHSLFVVGHSHDQALAEFAIPALVKSEQITDLLMASSPLQGFTDVLNQASGGNPQLIDRIGGMACFATPNGTEMIVNGYEYYDAPADNTHSTLLVRDADNLSTSAVDGFYSFSGGAGHTSGWLSPIPEAWQSALGGTYITGQSSGIPIIGRASVGPSAFAFDPLEVINTTPASATISSSKLLDFSLDLPLHDDLSNDSKTNDLWTHLSRAVYGFIVPGTRTYLTLGFSGGHNSGVCYKCTQNNGNVCGGYCTPDAADHYQFYWLWDVNDLQAVKEGRMEAHSVRPYASGPFSTPFESDAHALGGGTFDPESGTLYLSVQRADTQQGEYSNPPVIVAYKVNDEFLSVSNEPAELPESAAGFSVDLPYPNPFKSTSSLQLKVDVSQSIRITAHDALGRLVAQIHDGHLSANDRYKFTIISEDWPVGLYFILINGEQGQVVRKIALIE